MKRTFLFLVLLLFTYSAQAQIQRYPHYLGGDFGLSVGNGRTSVIVYPEVGWRIGDNLYAGIQAGFGYCDNGSYSDFSFGVIPNLRYYWYIYNRFGLSAEAGCALHLTRRSNWDSLIRSFDIGIRPGAVIPIGSRYALTVQVGFLGYEVDNYGDGVIDSRFGFRFQQNDFRVGFLMNI
ncbi:MAG: hypothetical protein IKX60_08880 [Bacteroidales bacterium]|nr:hypothetical protein [Bacteroidales bacterium]